MTVVDIEREFPNCEVLLCHEIKREVVEGEFSNSLDPKEPPGSLT